MDDGGLSGRDGGGVGGREIGGFLDHDVKVGDRVERKGAKPFIAKSQGSHAYSGKVVVLVNSSSAS